MTAPLSPSSRTQPSPPWLSARSIANGVAPSIHLLLNEQGVKKRYASDFDPEEADAVFNSALDYELAVLKPLASPLLNQIKPWNEEYIEARRLSGFLHNFSILSPDVVPGDSILREYIGDSQLKY